MTGSRHVAAEPGRSAVAGPDRPVAPVIGSWRCSRRVKPPADGRPRRRRRSCSGSRASRRPRHGLGAAALDRAGDHGGARGTAGRARPARAAADEGLDRPRPRSGQARPRCGRTMALRIAVQPARGRSRQAAAAAVSAGCGCRSCRDAAADSLEGFTQPASRRGPAAVSTAGCWSA